MPPVAAIASGFADNRVKRSRRGEMADERKAEFEAAKLRAILGSAVDAIIILDGRGITFTIDDEAAAVGLGQELEEAGAKVELKTG